MLGCCSTILLTETGSTVLIHGTTLLHVGLEAGWTLRRAQVSNQEPDIHKSITFSFIVPCYRALGAGMGIAAGWIGTADQSQHEAVYFNTSTILPR
jgi:hypothetical protein